MAAALAGTPGRGATGTSSSLFLMKCRTAISIRLQRGGCSAARAISTANTLPYAVAQEGVLLYEREVVIANLPRIAREDLDGARALASLGNRNAIYLCEQAAGKVIKAVLTSDLVPNENPLKPALRDIEELAAFATDYRYPTSSGRIPDAPGSEEFAGLATKVEAALRLGVDVAKKGVPAARPGPIR